MLPSLANHEVVCFGEVLWDVLPSKTLPGGAPMNVAYNLKRLGSNPVVITKVGIDERGKKLINLLSGFGLTTDYFQIDFDYPTGLVYAKLTEANDVMYDIVFPSAWDFIQWDEIYEHLAANAQFFVFGSLTSRNRTSKETLYGLLDIAKVKVLDINLRAPHFQRDDIEYLLRKTDLLKVNNNELEQITGWFSHFQSIEDRVKLLQERFNIETIIVTMGASGAMISDNGSIFRHPGYKVEVNDTIGSGDAFLAGYLHQVLNGSTVPAALQFASGMGAFIATQSGACPNYETGEIHALMGTYKNEKI